MSGYLLGATSVVAFALAVFFWTFWRRSHDALFLAFAAAFFLTGVNRSVTAYYVASFAPGAPEGEMPLIYLVRVLTYVILIAAIVHKNRSRPGSK